MLCGGDSHGLASSPMAKATTSSISLILAVCICAHIELARTLPIDKPSLLTYVNETSNSHDNQILKLTSIESNHHLQKESHEAQLTRNQDKYAPNSKSDIVRTRAELAQVRDVHERRVVHERRRFPRSTAASIMRPMISPQPPPLPPPPPLPLNTPTNSSGASGQATPPPTEYATVNYNGLIGVNATDPYAITTESRSFALPTEIQILMCLFYGTLAFTAITSNMTVCYIVLSNQRMRTATNLFIVNLAVGDILMALLCIPFTFPANLIFQFWPFGLSLCVLVSYSQAISVFISAYTMVAISIDKYIAIMHPMRLRMPKNQAKLIILVIWTAALMTSLPTALLSSLEPASPDLASPQASISTIENEEPPSSTSPTSFIPFEVTTTTEAYRRQSQYDPLGQSAQKSTQDTLHEAYERQQKLSLQPSGNSSESKASPSKATTTTSPSTSPTSSLSSPQGPNQTHKPQVDQHEEQTKYFCQESWSFWPKGKYFYSMALMVLQFVVPLFVLIVTYTRIVVVVWGKRMPGEEDNARDARMARSKRKMIKMVIFCVIAFALTWSPFNALIVIGDIAPEIWEHQSIMYIWFITHYLAMCHTITNPLIYIWMNNRFRAGFKQVIGDVCKFMHRIVAFVLCYCLCLGCCFNCSRQKYARVALKMDSKQRARRAPLASSGSINPYSTNGATHQHFAGTVSGIGFGGGGGGGSSVGGGGGNTTGASSGDGGVSLKTTNYYYTTATISSNQSNNDTLGKRTVDDGEQGSSSNGSRPVEVGGGSRAAASNRVCKFRSDPVCSFVDDDEARQWRHQRQRKQELQEEQQYIELGPMRAPGCAAGSGHNQVDARDDAGPSCPSQSAIKSPSGQKGAGLFQRRKRRQARSNERDQSLGKGAPSSGTPTEQELAAAAAAAKKRRRKRQTHAVCLELTTSQFYSVPPSLQPPGGQLVTSGGIASASTKHKASAAVSNCKRRQSANIREGSSSRVKTRQKRPIDYPHDCPSCRHASVSPLGPTPPSGSSQPYASLTGGGNCAKFGQFLVDTRHSSQSTATISAQTNNTSLAISPISSMREASNRATIGTEGGDDGGNIAGNPASISNSNNTSASLSANGLASEQLKDGSGGDGADFKKAPPSGGEQGQARNCATDDDADDNSINGHALGRLDDNVISSEVPEQVEGGAAAAAAATTHVANGEMDLMRTGRPDSSGSNNLKLAVNVTDEDHSWAGCCLEGADLLQPPSAYADQANASESCLHLALVSPSRALQLASNVREITAGAMQLTNIAFIPANGPNSTTTTAPRAGNEIDAPLGDSCATKLSGAASVVATATSLEHRSVAGDNTRENCNQSASSSVSPPLDGKLAGAQQGGRRRWLWRGHHHTDDSQLKGGANRSQQRAVHWSQQRFCRHHRQTVSAIEVDQLRHHQGPLVAAVNGGGGGGGAGREGQTGDSAFKASDHTDFEFHLRLNERALCGILGDMNATQAAHNKPKGTKSMSAVELMSDHLLRGRRLRRHGYESAADYDNEASDDDSDRQYSPWSTSDIEAAPVVGQENNYSMEDEETGEEEEREQDDDESDGSELDDSDSPDCVRLMSPRPIGTESNQTAMGRPGSDVQQHLNGLLQSGNDALAREKGNLNHCSSVHMVRAHYRDQSLTDTKMN